MAISSFPFKDIIHRCFRCGYCKFPINWIDVNNCPSYGRFRIESYSCGGRLWLIRAWINGWIDVSDHFAEIVYSCVVCKNCEIKCPFSFNTHIVDMVISARKELVELGKIPKGVKRFLTNVNLYKNPYGIKNKKRTEWIKDLDIQKFDGQEYLFYIGCTGSFDPIAQEMTRSVTEIFLDTGLSFGILKEEEICDGNEVRMLGEEGLFEELVLENIKLFKSKRVKKIITLSPHAYNVFKNYYPLFGGDFEIFHYTHIILYLLNKNLIRLKKHLPKKITYHDPCFLGRWNKEYETPRKILKKIPGAKVSEMTRSKEGSLCCGGGGGNFYMDLLGGSPESPSRIRVKEAKKIKSEIIAVACPKCLVMLKDAVISEGLEKEIEVLDISQIIKKAM